MFVCVLNNVVLRKSPSFRDCLSKARAVRGSIVVDVVSGEIMFQRGKIVSRKRRKVIV